MALKLSRKELYELVWARPRSQIAKELGVSDVMIGKLCRQMNVPAPTPGYWTNLGATRRRRKYLKPPLTYNLAERIADDHASLTASMPAFDAKDLEQSVPPPPIIVTSFEETLERYRQEIDKASVPRLARGSHAVVQKFLAEDERLSKLKSQFSYYKPKFQTTRGQELLEGLNKLLWLWTDLGFKPSSSGSRHIKTYVSCAGSSRSFEIVTTDEDDNHARSKTRGFELRFDTYDWDHRSKKADFVFSTFSGPTLRSITLLLVERWEKQFRDSIHRSYEWKVAERKRLVESAEQEKEQLRQQRLADHKALVDSRLKLLHDGIRGVERSDQIRSLVRALDERVGSNRSVAFDRWRRWALEEADAIDPRARSTDEITAWVNRYQLDE